MADVEALQERARALDAADPTASYAGDFADRPGIYLAGNSLGPPTTSAVPDMVRAISEEWARGLVGSWNTAGWFDLPTTLGAHLARYLGNVAETTIVAESTSLLLYKLLTGARTLTDRSTLAVHGSTFPTDAHIAQAAADSNGWTLRLFDDAELSDVLDTAPGVMLFNHVDYRTGELFDIDSMTGAAHRAGAIAVWDLSHSVGVLPIDLAASRVDLAVGCTYKYLNGGPGSPAFMYVRPHHLEQLHLQIPGWMGHAAPFQMSLEHEPAPDINRLRTGTPHVLSMLGLHHALLAQDRHDLGLLRAKSVSLTGWFIEACDHLLGDVVEVITPRDPKRRGGQVSLRHEHAFAIVTDLKRRGVVGDFRAPDVGRFGFGPAYLSHSDALAAVIALRDSIEATPWTGNTPVPDGVVT